MRFWPHNVRTRLTLWYTAVLAGALIIYGAGTAALVLHQLRAELDRLAIDDFETVEGLLSFAPDGKLFLRNDYHDHPYPASVQDRLVEVRGEDGTFLYRNELLGQNTLGGIPGPGEGVGGNYAVRSIALPGGTHVRVIGKRHTIDGRITLIRVGFSEDILWNRFWQIALGMLAGLPFALGLAALGGYFLARKALRPIERMAHRVNEINADKLSARLAVEDPDDELGVLASAFNNTLSRLERSFEQLRRFTADASHELRTPLTVIRSVGEVGLQKEGSSEQYREVIASMLEEVTRLNRLVDSLLIVARAESGQIKLRRTTVFLTPLLREAVAFLQVLAEEKSQTISVEERANAQLDADGAVLRQVFINLLDNAIKYSPVGTTISVRIAPAEDQAVAVDVQDAGPGIPPEHRAKVFDRLYRVDEARSREAGGAGLGLAIAKWGVETHDGRLELECPPSGGCVFRVWLHAIAIISSGPHAQSAPGKVPALASDLATK